MRFFIGRRLVTETAQFVQIVLSIAVSAATIFGIVKVWITEAEYQEITGDAYTAPAVQPSGSETGITERMQTMETRFDAQEGAINDLLISVIPELLGGE